MARRSVPQIALNKRGPLVNGLTMTFAQIIDDGDLMARIQEFFNANTANIAGPAGDENFHAVCLAEPTGVFKPIMIFARRRRDLEPMRRDAAREG